MPKALQGFVFLTLIYKYWGTIPFLKNNNVVSLHSKNNIHRLNKHIL